MATTPRAPRKPRSAAAPKPTLKVTGLNLDLLEKEGETPDPYTFVLKAEMYTIPAPDDLDWQDVAMVTRNDVIQIIRTMLGPDEYARFAKHRMPLWKLRDLVKDSYRHYGIPFEGPGEESALPTS